MHDIARLAGVSQSTVSRVLGSRAGEVAISEAVKRRIHRVADRMDYRLNPTAVALRTGSGHTVLVVVSDITDSYYGAIISGIESVLVTEGWSMLLHSLLHTGPADQIGALVRRQQAGGVLLLGALPGVTNDSLGSLARRKPPIVIVGRSMTGVASVTADNGMGGRLAAGLLWDLGHRKIAWMQGPRGWPDFSTRISTFRRTLRARGADEASLHNFPCPSRDPRAGHAATRALLAKWAPSALFCLNDSTALGAMRALREVERRVPEEVSVIGFDDGELAEESCPSLTTIRQPRFEMGRAGAALLLGIVGGTAKREAIVLPVTLIERESTCRAQRKKG